MVKGAYENSLQNTKMRIVIDTNCFLMILPKKSIFRPIFDSYRLGNLEFDISNEIIEEYSEIIAQKRAQ
jgi:uncharacterized protein